MSLLRESLFCITLHYENGKLYRFDAIAINVIVGNCKGGINLRPVSCFANGHEKSHSEEWLIRYVNSFLLLRHRLRSQSFPDLEMC